MRTSPEFEELLKPRVFATQILWSALTFSILIYVFIAYKVEANNAESGPAALEPVMLYAMYAVAALTVIGSLVIRSVFFSQTRLKKMLSKEVSVERLALNPQTGQLDQTRAEKIKRMSGNELKAIGLTGQMFTPFIFILALNESVAIYGLILSFLSFRGEVMLPFAAAAIMLNVMMFGKVGAGVRQGLEILENPRFGRRA